MAGGNLAAARAALKHHFGYDSFRPGQERVISGVLAGRDGLAVMPTGAGKSICYQVPAAVLPGVAVVISPLISLMEDQVASLQAVGIRAACLTSHKTHAQREAALSAAYAGALKVLYVAPERLVDAAFAAFLSSAQISLVAVDEAHCVSQWGQDFRQSYLQIGPVLAAMARRPPVLALTATATPRVRDDIAALLGLRAPVLTMTTFDRPNLNLSVRKMAKAKKTTRIIAHSLAHPSLAGIVYCATRKEVERVADALLEAGVNAACYHAGMAPDARAAAQRRFIMDDVQVMVATSAFGMGIDKPDVRWVIHNNLPASLEQYYQEAGRAGRDGAPADCLLLWDDADFATLRYFIERDIEDDAFTEEARSALRATRARMLSVMANYCLTGDCLHDFILRYFGEEPPTRQNSVTPDLPHGGEGVEFYCEGSTRSKAEGVSFAGENSVTPDLPHGGEGASVPASAAAAAAAPATPGCGMCSNCTEGVRTRDVTEDARHILRCVHALRGQYGKTLVAEVCTGANTERTRSLRAQAGKSFGALKCTKSEALDLIEMLVARQLLEITPGEYPLLGLGPFWLEAGQPKFKVSIKSQIKAVSKSKKMAKAAHHTAPTHTSGAHATRAATGVGGEALQVRADDELLFESLRQLRKQISDAEGVPPYVVASDATLRDMCARRPKDEAALLDVHGIGPTKAERYGQQFLAALNSHLPR